MGRLQHLRPYVDAIGAHRWPLFSGLEMVYYREWLAQRRALIPPGKMTWTWVQTHLPGWLAELVCGQADPPSVAEPIGPHPEQIRILTYLSLAAGHKGLGFWSDQYLDTLHHGRDRMLELALINTEIDMLKPVLFGAESPARWIGTSDPNVQAAVLAGAKETLVLPVWLGYGTQYTPAQAALPALSLIVPNIPDGATPWLITPAGISEIKAVNRVHGGTQITITEFDTTAAVVFTSDLGPLGKVVRWQDHTRCVRAGWSPGTRSSRRSSSSTRRSGPTPASWRPAARTCPTAVGRAVPPGRGVHPPGEDARRQQPVRRRLPGGPPGAAAVAGADAGALGQGDRDAGHADGAPFAVSFYTLPEHWKMAHEVRTSRPAGNAFPNGGFELSRSRPRTAGRTCRRCRGGRSAS